MATLPIPGMLLSSTLPASSLGAPLSATPSTSPGTGATPAAALLPASIPNPFTAVSTFAQYFRPSRVATFIVGALLIAGGIFALKPVREVARSAARTARRVAETSASAAA